MGELLASLSFREKKNLSGKKEKKRASLPLLAFLPLCVVDGSVYGKVGTYSNVSCESLCVVK